MKHAYRNQYVPSSPTAATITKVQKAFSSFIAACYQAEQLAAREQS